VLYEPHTGRMLQLGTREVDAYEFPAWLYDKILYVEKRGLWPILQAARLAERYDMAVIAAEGYATEATRLLFAQAEQGRNYQLFVLHDADPYGYNIARTLREETDRMPGYHVEVIDVGLHLEAALAMGLGVETFTRKQALPAGLVLTETERVFFEGRRAGEKSWVCRRIELNALSAPALVAYTERQLRAAGVRGKVIPPHAILPRQAEMMYRQQVDAAVDRTLERLLATDDIKDALADTFQPRMGLGQARRWIKQAFRKDDTRSWRAVLEAKIRERLGQLGIDFEDRVRRKMIEAMRRVR
jgi:hypothetical protein